STRTILRVHQSNFRMVGFTERPAVDELAELARRLDVPLVDDLGSGQLVDLPSLIDEPTAAASVAAGATLVCFSGDKLLGGLRAGEPPVVARVQEGQVLLDCRTLTDADADEIPDVAGD